MIRRRKIAWGRRVLGAFVAAWLGVFLQPCVMAAGNDHDRDHDCPHCPPVETREQPPCHGEVEPDCVLDDPLQVEPRNAQVKVKDAPNELLVAAPQLPYEGSRRVGSSRLRLHESALIDPGGPPCHVLYCVYLK